MSLWKQLWTNNIFKKIQVVQNVRAMGQQIVCKTDNYLIFFFNFKLTFNEMKQTE